MAGLAYLLLPVSGVIAFLFGSSARVRFHGLQAIAIGFAWPVVLYAATFASPIVTQAFFAVGAVVWFLFLVGAAMGRDPKLPGAWKTLRRLALEVARPTAER